MIDGNDNPRWLNNEVQFARLLCELEAAGAFTSQVMDDLCISMDLVPGDISELQERANTVWEAAKAAVTADSCPVCGSTNTTRYPLGDGASTLYCDDCKSEG